VQRTLTLPRHRYWLVRTNRNPTIPGSPSPRALPSSPCGYLAALGKHMSLIQPTLQPAGIHSLRQQPSLRLYIAFSEDDLQLYKKAIKRGFVNKIIEEEGQETETTKKLPLLPGLYCLFQNSCPITHPEFAAKPELGKGGNRGSRLHHAWRQ
jgi:hypothetical protein